MPTIQNKTIKAVATTCSDSRFISGNGLEPAAKELGEFPGALVCAIRIGSRTLPSANIYKW